MIPSCYCHYEYINTLSNDFIEGGVGEEKRSSAFQEIFIIFPVFIYITSSIYIPIYTPEKKKGKNLHMIDAELFSKRAANWYFFSYTPAV